MRASQSENSKSALVTQGMKGSLSYLISHGVRQAKYWPMYSCMGQQKCRYIYILITKGVLGNKLI